MDLKRLIRPFALPAWKLYWSLRNRRLRFWKGVYADYRDAPSSGGGFNSAIYVRREVAETVPAIDAARACADRREDIRTSFTLPILACTVSRANAGRLCVLDLGGGIGSTYLEVLGTAVSCSELEYHVVELEWACLEGARLFADDPRIRFHRAPPAGLRQVDIVYASGVLMYVEDYAAMLRRLCAYGARYVFIENLAAGPFPTFASTQVNIGPGPVPHWFFNVDEIVRLVEAEGYGLAYRSAEPLAGAHDNFDSRYQLDKARYWSLLFENRSA